MSRKPLSLPPLSRLEAIDAESGRVNVVIDAPRGSRCKYKYDEAEGFFRLKKLLPLGAAFPYAFGFVPATLGGDGDPLDVLVILDEPVFVGCVVPVRLVGVIEAEQTGKDGKTVRNDRLLGVVETPNNPPEVSSLHDLSRQRLDEIEHFFVSYNEMEGRRFRPIARQGPGTAGQLLAEGMRRAAAKRRKSSPARMR